MQSSTRVCSETNSYLRAGAAPGRWQEGNCPPPPPPMIFVFFFFFFFLLSPPPFLFVSFFFLFPPFFFSSFFFLSAQRSVMSMMVIPLPHCDNILEKIMKSKKKMCWSPPQCWQWRSISGLAQQWRGLLPPPPPLSKHPGAAPA